MYIPIYTTPNYRTRCFGYSSSYEAQSINGTFCLLIVRNYLKVLFLWAQIEFIYIEANKLTNALFYSKQKMGLWWGLIDPTSRDGNG